MLSEIGSPSLAKSTSPTVLVPTGTAAFPPSPTYPPNPDNALTPPRPIDKPEPLFADPLSSNGGDGPVGLASRSLSLGGGGAPVGVSETDSRFVEFGMMCSMTEEVGEYSKCTDSGRGEVERVEGNITCRGECGNDSS